MYFNKTEWIGEIVATTLAGAGAGLVNSLFSGQELKQLIGSVAVYALAGVVGGALYYPVKQSWGGKGSNKLADRRSSSDKAYRDNEATRGKIEKAKQVEPAQPTQRRTGVSIKNNR